MIMIKLVWDLVSRVFVFIGVGMILEYIARKKGEKLVKGFVWFALNILIPVFMFFAMWAGEISFFSAKKILAAAILVVSGGIVLAVMWSRVRNMPFRQQCLPIIFMNSAYLAIPVNTILWGREGTIYAIIYNVVITIIHFTFGIWMVNKGSNIKEILGIPVIYAIAAGILLNYSGVRLPGLMFEFNKAVSAITLPVMLVFVGFRLAGISIKMIGPAFGGVVLRMLGGWFLGLAGVILFNITGPAAAVCMITSSMPPAVNTYILSERFKSDYHFASAAIFIGTLLSLISVPLTAYFAAGFIQK